MCAIPILCFGTAKDLHNNIPLNFLNPTVGYELHFIDNYTYL